jgi:small redox-active disulfide protein 2
VEIKVLGTGCTKCKQLEATIKKVVFDLSLSANVEKVDDIMKIMEYGIMSTPGMVINGKVVVSGRVPSEKEIAAFILKAEK